MKKLTTLFFVFTVGLVSGQEICENYCLDFENSYCLDHLIIESIAYPGNLWQIGKPQKILFDSAYSQPNAIVTDTIQFYPVNNHSAFTIWNPATMGDIYGLRGVSGWYQVQTDSLKDYGMIEFSPDMGETWIDIINDTLYNTTFNWFTDPPTLTGNSDGWVHFEVLLTDIGSAFDIQLGDTLLMRFSFISDENEDNRGGLMYDNLCYTQFVEGITETRFKTIRSKISPNPVLHNFKIEFENPGSQPFQLNVYDIHSKLMMSKENIFENQVKLDALRLKPGTYIYKLTNQQVHERSWGKFVVVK